jgi:serine/threonine-protein kinase Chk1
LYQRLKHPNLAGMVGFSESSVKIKNDGSEVPVAYLLLELISNGEFFIYISKGAFEESVCRFYFKQMIGVMDYVHSQGFAHRDLKSENIMVDSEFNLRIIDLG